MTTISDIKTKYCIDAVSFPKEVDTVLKKNAPALLKMLNAEFKKIGSDAKFEMPSTNVNFSDGYYIRLKPAGKWDDKSRMLALRLNKTARNGVIFRNQSWPAIYLEKGSRPESHRGQIGAI